MRKGSLIRGVRGRYAAFTHDLVMVPVAWLGALWLRFNLGDIPDVYLYHALLDLATIVPIQVAVFWCFGLYRGVWHFASLPDLVRIAKAVLTGSVAVAYKHLPMLEGQVREGSTVSRPPDRLAACWTLCRCR